MIHDDATRSRPEAHAERGATARRAVATLQGASATADGRAGPLAAGRAALAEAHHGHGSVRRVARRRQQARVRRKPPLKKGARGERVKVEPDGKGLEKLRDVGESEPIYLVAHSGGQLVWNLDPAAMAAKLFEYLPDGYKGAIKLVACHTGEQRASQERYRALGETTTYAQELAYELLQLQGASKRGVAIRAVHGRPGVATIDPVTGKRRVYASSGRPRPSAPPSTPGSSRSWLPTGQRWPRSRRPPRSSMRA